MLIIWDWSKEQHRLPLVLYKRKHIHTISVGHAAQKILIRYDSFTLWELLFRSLNVITQKYMTYGPQIKKKKNKTALNMKLRNKENIGPILSVRREKDHMNLKTKYCVFWMLVELFFFNKNNSTWPYIHTVGKPYSMNKHYILFSTIFSVKWLHYIL